jgi:putative endonuclease
VKLLVYVEPHEDASTAKQRESTIKKWRRAWKLELIERNNPKWRDLAEEFLA